MGNNLTTQYISSSFQGLVQISGSQLTDGTGSLIDSLNITASDAVAATSASYSATATSASYAETATSSSYAVSSSHSEVSDTAISSSYALTASFAENVTTPTLQEVTTEGATTNVLTSFQNGIVVTGSINQIILKDTVGVSIGAIDFDGNTGNLNISTNAGGTNTLGVNAFEILSATSVTASAGFTGSLQGNADTATSASYAATASFAANAGSSLLAISSSHSLVSDTAVSSSYSDTALSSSYALTASYLEGGVTAFPFTGSAGIQGEVIIEDPAFLVSGSISGVPPTYTNNTGSLFLGRGIQFGSSASVDSNIDSFIGGIVADKGTPLYATYVSESKNSLIFGLTQPQSFQTAGAIQRLTGSAVIASNGALVGYSPTYAGNVASSAMIGSSGTMVGGMANSGMFGVFGGTLRGSSNTGRGMVVVGGASNLLNRCNDSGIFAGTSNSMPNAFNDANVMIGGSSNNLNSGQRVAMIGGTANTSNSNANKSIIGGEGSTLSNGNYSGMWQCRYSSYNLTEMNTIIGDQQSNVTANPVWYNTAWYNNYGISDENQGYNTSTTNTFISNNTTKFHHGKVITAIGNQNGKVGSDVRSLVLNNYADNTNWFFISGSATSGSLAGDRNAIVSTYSSSIEEGLKTTLWGTDGVVTSNLEGTFILPNSGSAGTYTKDYTLYAEHVDIRQTLVLQPQATLPTGEIGMIAVSGSSGAAKPYFFDGSTWTAMF